VNLASISDLKERRALDKIHTKAVMLCNYISTHRHEWMQHRAIYNQVLSSQHDRFKKTVTSANNDVKKCNTRIQKKEGELLAAKTKLVIARTEIKTMKKSYMLELREQKSANEVSIKKLRHDKNVLSTRVRKLEAELKKKKSQRSKAKEESLELYRQKLDLRAEVEGKRYYMKNQQLEEKKEGERKTRRKRAVELQSQISIVGRRFNGFDTAPVRNDYSVTVERVVTRTMSHHVATNRHRQRKDR